MRRAALWIALWVVPASAEELAPLGNRLKLSDTVQSVKIGGDFRLRHESLFKRGPGTNDRSRARLRLRIGADIELPESLLLGLRLATGSGEQNSTHATFSKLGSQKDLWLDWAYLRWTRSLAQDLKLTLTGGRMPIPFWRPYANEMVWDDDFNPEGFFEGVEWAPSGGGLTLFVNGLQMVTDEDSNSGKNQWLFTQYAGFEAKLPRESQLKLQAGYHKWSDENRSSLSPVSTLDGNRRAGNALLNRFGVGELTGELSTKVRELPVAFQASLIRNFRARGDMASTTACTAGETCPVARDGHHYGLIVGQAKAAGSWELAAFRRYVQTDATVADLSDSDFGDGGTNRKGYVFWGAYNPRGWLQFKARYFVTETIDTQFNPGDKAINRLQLDLNVKF